MLKMTKQKLDLLTDYGQGFDDQKRNSWRHFSM